MYLILCLFTYEPNCMTIESQLNHSFIIINPAVSIVLEMDCPFFAFVFG